VFFFSYAEDGNLGAIWDASVDRWEELPGGGRPRSRFSHFKTDAGVVILGGNKDADDAWAFSMEDRSWRRVQVPSQVGFKERPGAGWTGKEAWIWEGMPFPRTPEKAETVSAGLLDLGTGAWKPFPSGGPSPRHSPFSAWTGKEILFLGGAENSFWGLRDAWAFNPSTSTWRRLDSRDALSPLYAPLTSPLFPSAARPA
jgi:hypothetical protein